MWVVFAAAIPWLWFLVRDLGPVAQLVALALPAIVAAALIGFIISAFDDRKLSSLPVVVSVLRVRMGDDRRTAFGNARLPARRSSGSHPSPWTDRP